MKRVVSAQLTTGAETFPMSDAYSSICVSSHVQAFEQQGNVGIPGNIFAVFILYLVLESLIIEFYYTFT